MEVANWVCFELLLGFLVSRHFGQSADPVVLKTAVQRGPREVRDRGLQGLEAIVQRQQSVPTEGNDDGLFLDRQCRGLAMLRACRQVAH